MSGPLSVTGVGATPSDPVCAHVGNSPCAAANPAPPAMVFKRVRRSTDTIVSLLACLTICTFPSLEGQARDGTAILEYHLEVPKFAARARWRDTCARPRRVLPKSQDRAIPRPVIFESEGRCLRAYQWRLAWRRQIMRLNWTFALASMAVLGGCATAHGMGHGMMNHEEMMRHCQAMQEH